jgi:hypothetical protein
MLATKLPSKNPSGLRYKSHNFSRPSRIALSDFIRIQNSISPLNTEIIERQNYDNNLRMLSKNKSINWNDSVEQRKKMEYEMAKRRFLKEEERRRKIDEQERKYTQAKENMLIEKAREHLFNEQDAVKSFNSKLLFCDVLKEREYQKEINLRKKERSDIIEKTFFDMDKKIMEEKNRIEEEKKKVEDEKKKQRMKMLNDQMNEIKIRKIQEYEDNLVEGQILKMQIRRDLAQEQKEKELKEKKILEQKQIYMEENKKLMEEKEKIKMREIEEEKKIEEFAIKKDELNALRKQKEEEKMKKKLADRQKLIDKQIEYLQNLRNNENEILEKQVQMSNEKKEKEEKQKNEKYEKMIKEINLYREEALKNKEEIKRKNKEDDIKYIQDYKNQMQQLLDEEKKEKENKRKKEKELCEYQKLQYEQRKRQGLDDFIKLNEDAYNNMKRMEKENDDFITYAEGRIQEYKEQGKNVYPLLLELKKYRQKYG